MKLKSVLLAAAILAAPAVAYADPTGSYDVQGVNPDTGDSYSGEVHVVRKGQTYTVVWDIDGTESIGTGLGAKFVGNRFQMGAASDDDQALAVGYVSEDNSFGIAMFFEQPDGSWAGVWTYGGNETVAQETWTRQ